MNLDDRIKYVEMKARHSQLFVPWYKKWWGIILLLILSLVLAAIIASTIYVIKEVKRIQAGESLNALENQGQIYLNLINGGSPYATGSPDPKITIVEFNDFTCPFCKQASEEMRKLTEEYKQTVRYVVRDYPIHDTSIDLSLAARCAGEQGQYWEAFDSLFLNQDYLKEPTTIKADIISWANSLNVLDMAKFEACFNNRTYISEIKKDYDDGQALQIQGTPTWFVNNYPLTGYYPTEKFRELFDGILQQLSLSTTTENN